jgi:hypothetical protein
MQNVLQESFSRTTHGYLLGMHPHMESQVLEWKPGAQARVHPMAACEYTNVNRPMTAGTDGFLVLFWDYGTSGKAAS